MISTTVTTIASSVEEFLSCHAISYDILSHVPTQSLEQAAARLKISPYEFARAVILCDGDEICMAVLPLNYILDFSALYEITNRNYKPASVHAIGRIFQDCELGAIPPLGMAYGLKTLVDNSLYRADHVIFEAGRHNSLVRINRKGFLKLTQNAKHTNFARPESSLKQGDSGSQSGVSSDGDEASFKKFTPHEKMDALIRDLYEIPDMPGTAKKIIELQADPDATADDLCSILEQEPAVAEQLLQYARSSLFANKEVTKQDKVDTVKDAISQTLGFDLASSLAIGMCALKSFRGPPGGPIGRDSLWEHASYSTVLISRLVKHVSKKHKLKPDVMCLASLLHNSGLLLFGHLFQSEFFLLNRMISVNPAIPVVSLETRMLAMGKAREVLHLGHSTAGSCLMKKWNLPEEVTVAIQEHHNVNYHGPHEVYVKLILVIDRVLKRYQIGDGCSEFIPASVLDFLGLSEEQVVSECEELLENCEDV